MSGGHVVLLVTRLAVAYLFFAQLFWKLPPDFGCQRAATGFVVTAAAPDGGLQRGTGLCDWLGVEAVFAERERTILAVDFDNDGAPDWSLSLAPLVRLNGRFLTGVVLPHLTLFGWLIWVVEAWIVVSLGLGLLTRLGAAASLLLAVQLTLGLAGVSDPDTHLQEWEWSYLQLVLLSSLLLALPSGRLLGVDGWLRHRSGASGARPAAGARLLAALT